jgi:hypothetical protein
VRTMSSGSTSTGSYPSLYFVTIWVDGQGPEQVSGNKDGRGVKTILQAQSISSA